MPKGVYPREQLKAEGRWKNVGHYKRTPEMYATRQGDNAPFKGSKHTEEARRRISEAKKGKKNYFYIDGRHKERTAERILQRFTVEYKIWRTRVFERDHFTCQVCEEVGGKLQAHHIKEWANYPELRYEVSNGITLCVDCHRLTDNYGGRKLKK